MSPNADSPQQSILENAQATTITVGNITQTIVYQQRPKPLSTAIDSALPPIAHWQARDEEGLIADYFTDAQVRLVGISAAGGYGKSALAARLSGQATGFVKKLWANFQEPANFGTFGRWLISQLLGEERYALVRETYERDADAELITKALNLLTQDRHLLILDNLETLFQSTELWQPYGEFLSKWLGRGGGGVILLTSQIKLELPTAAWRWETIAGLAIDQGVALLQAEQIEGEPADLRAFVSAADGHPLLLKLTASLLRREQATNYEPATIYRLQRDDVTLLREIRERHRDVETSVGELLDRAFDRFYPQHLQVLLLRLSVLRQRFGLAAAQAMVDEPIDLPDLRKLVRSSFLQEQRQGEDWWFDFLPLIQRYLRQRAGQELTVAHEKAIDFFWNHRKPEKKVLEDCREELEAFHHRCELGQYLQAYEVINTCVRFLELAGYYSSLVPVYERLTQEWQANDDAEIQNLGWAWTQLGNTYQSLGRFQDAIAAHRHAQQQFQSTAHRQGEAAALGNLGNAYDSLGRYQQAIDFHQESLAIQREIGNRKGEASALGNLGNAYRSLGQYQQAIDLHQQNLSIDREIGDQQGEANALGNLGSACKSLGQYQQAIDFQQESLAIQREIGNRKGEASALGNIGNAYYSIGQYQQAIDLHQQHLSIAREIGDRQGEANALGNLGNAYHSLGQYQQAIDCHQQHLSIAREIGDRHGEASALGNLGNAYKSLGQYQQAIDLHQQNLSTACEIGDQQGKANALGNLGDVYKSLGQYQQAIDFHQQHLSIAREIGDRHGEASALGNLGLVHKLLGQYQQAIDLHQQNLSIAREIGDRRGEAAALGNLGIAYHSLGQYQQAIDLLEQSLNIQREIGNRRGEAIVLGSLGNTYYLIGQSQQAIDLHQQNLSIAREIGDRQGEAAALGNLGIAYYSLEQHPQAIDLHQQNLNIAREIGDRQGEANALGNLGNAYYSLGQCSQAIDCHQQNLSIAREIGYRYGEASALGNLGVVHKSLGQYQQAIDFHQQHLSIAREIGDRHGEANALFNLAHAFAKFDQHWEGLQKLNQAKQLYAALKLNHKVEECDAAIYAFNRNIAAKPRPVPKLRDEPPLPDWWEKSLPTSTQPKPQRSQMRVPLWVYFLLGLAIVLLIAWLL